MAVLGTLGPPPLPALRCPSGQRVWWEGNLPGKGLFLLECSPLAGQASFLLEDA